MAHMSSRHILPLLTAACLLLCQAGCGNFLHNLKPHRLRMLNYNSSASTRDDVYFSISDPLEPASQHTGSAADHSKPSAASAPAASAQ